jgi:hypothetical protein
MHIHSQRPHHSRSNVRVATSEAKKAGGRSATGVNGGTPLRSVACNSTTSCIAVDGNDEFLNLTIAAGGGAAGSTQALAGAGELTGATCTGTTCVATAEQGGIFASTNSGSNDSSWSRRFEAASKLRSVSCAPSSLCAGVDTSGDLVKLGPV